MAWHLSAATFCSTKTVWPRENESESHPADSMQHLVYRLIRGDLSISVKWMLSDEWLKATILILTQKDKSLFPCSLVIGHYVVSEIHWVVVFYKLPMKTGPQSQWELIWALGWTQSKSRLASLKFLFKNLNYNKSPPANAH